MTTPVYASFWRRVGASLIDSVIFAIVMLIISTIVFGQDYLTWMLQSNKTPLEIYSPMATVLNYGVPILITVYLWVRYMGTPGKLLLSCHVVDADTLQPMTPSQSVYRYFAYLISTIPLFLGYFWVIWDKRHQAFHDKLTNTVVIVVDDAEKTVEELEQEAL